MAAALFVRPAAAESKDLAALEIELIGVFESRDTSRAMIAMKGLEEGFLVGEGDLIAGYTLSRIDNGSIRLVRGEERETLLMKNLKRVAADLKIKTYTPAYDGDNSTYPTKEAPKPTLVAESRRAVSGQRFIRPMADGWISSGFGYRKPPSTKGGRYGSRYHKGVDIAAPYGTRVVAAAAGTVLRAVSSSSLGGSKGRYVEIRHAEGYTTHYYHLSRVYVKAGQKVEAGQVVGAEGSTGNSSGPHLHFEIQKNGVAKNPADYIRSLR